MTKLSITPEQQVKNLSPSIWTTISKTFKDKTKLELTLTETQYTKAKRKNVVYQRILFYFICDDVPAGVGLEIPNKVLKNLEKLKDVYNNIINEASIVMLAEYSKWKETHPEGNK